MSVCINEYENFALTIGLFLVKGLKSHEWVIMDPMLSRLHISHSSFISLVDHKTGN